jgi:hypothetical protein
MAWWSDISQTSKWTKKKIQLWLNSPLLRRLRITFDFRISVYIDDFGWETQPCWNERCLSPYIYSISPKPWLRHWSFSTYDIFCDPIVRDKMETLSSTKLLHTVIIHWTLSNMDVWPNFGSFFILLLYFLTLEGLTGSQPRDSMHANMNNHRIRTRISQSTL